MVEILLSEKEELVDLIEQYEASMSNATRLLVRIYPGNIRVSSFMQPLNLVERITIEPRKYPILHPQFYVRFFSDLIVVMEL